MTELGEGQATPDLRPATPADLAGVLRILEAAGLPTAGAAEHLSGFVVAEAAGVLVGVGGLEVHGRDGVLRSVVVVPDRQGDGLGRRLTARVLETARARGLRRVYLLTTTADAYFPRFGFRRVPRGEASPEVRGSVEFRDACPASATAMALDLNVDGEEGGR